MKYIKFVLGVLFVILFSVLIFKVIPELQGDKSRDLDEDLIYYNDGDVTCIDIEYWYNSGEGITYENVDRDKLNKTINCLNDVLSGVKVQEKEQ